MKKNLFIALVAVAITTASCRKDVTCTCNATTTLSTTNGNTTVTSSSTSSDKVTYMEARKKTIKKDANCVDRTETSTSVSGGQNQTVRVYTTEYACELK